MKKPLTILAIIIVVIGGTVAGLELSNTTHWFHGPDKTKLVTKVGDMSSLSQSKTNNEPSDQDNSPGKGKQSRNTSRNIGAGTDTGGQTKAQSSQSQWITSRSSKITVKQPLANTTISDGFSLVGKADVSEVNFRLIDNKTGVISRGVLSVDNGRFSGKIHFHTSGTTGRLDVFSQSPDGEELNEIQMAVKF